MNAAARIALGFVRATGVTQVLIGLLLWSGRGYSLLSVHMLVGVAFVVALWVLCVMAARAGLRSSLVVAAVSWGFLVPVFGILHPRLLPGSSHWVVRLTHLLIGVAAMAIGARLARVVRRRASAESSPANTASYNASLPELSA